uniref:Glucan endo-1,3-beta-D-glucosidase n=1 Tax=Oryza barthii TaxID=65489 RepID=A0A0D3EYI1_9ORYZ
MGTQIVNLAGHVLSGNSSSDNATVAAHVGDRRGPPRAAARRQGVRRHGEALRHLAELCRDEYPGWGCRALWLSRGRHGRRAPLSPSNPSSPVAVLPCSSTAGCRPSPSAASSRRLPTAAATATAGGRRRGAALLPSYLSLSSLLAARVLATLYAGARALDGAFFLASPGPDRCLQPPTPLLRLLRPRAAARCHSPSAGTTSRHGTRWCSCTSPRASTGMRIYYPDKEALNALRNSGIALILDVGDQLSYLAASSSNAAAWVRDNVRPYYPAVNIKYIAVGNEVEGGATNSILPAIRNVNSALASSGLGAIKASTAVKFDVISNSYPPSAGVFRDAYMKDIARYLASTGAPLLANVYPYFAYRGNPRDISLNYATFRPGTTVRDPNNGLTYTNLFDAMVDAVYAALEKAGAGNVKVVVSESGWPSAGGFGASVDNARAYNQGLIDHVGRGTPKRPGALEAYIFAMFNENQKNGDPTEKNFGLFYPNKSPKNGDPTEKNFGLFYPNKSPVYPIRFYSGKPKEHQDRDHIVESAIPLWKSLWRRVASKGRGQ